MWIVQNDFGLVRCDQVPQRVRLKMGSNPNFRLHNIIRTFIERPWGSLGQEHFAAGVKAVNDCVRKSMRIEEGRFLSI